MCLVKGYKLKNYVLNCTCIQSFVARGVAVVINAQHQCMTTRGIKKSESATITSRMLRFRTDARTRSKFLNFIGK